MKVAVAAIDTGLADELQAQIETCGHEALQFGSLGEAVSAGPELVFAEWHLGEHLVGVLEGLHAAVSREPAIPVVVLVPPGAVSSVHRARAAGA